MFEPLLLHLFLLHASVDIVYSSLSYLKHLFTLFLFPNRTTLLMLYSFVESVSFFFCAYHPSQTDAQNIFAQQLPGVMPLNSKVLWSILSSTIIEVLKKRWTLLNIICPNQENQENPDMMGMPPSYIVVDISWEDPDDDSDHLEVINEEKRIETKNENLENNLDNQIGKKYQDFFQNYWRTSTFVSFPRNSLCLRDHWQLKIGTSLLWFGKQWRAMASYSTANGLCIKQLEVVSVSQMLNVLQLVPPHKDLVDALLPHLAVSPGVEGGGGLPPSSTAECEPQSTKDFEGIWYVLAGEIKFILVNTAVGVIISLAFINAKDIIDETKEYEPKCIENLRGKVRTKEKKTFSGIKSKCRKLSPSNKKESVSNAATTLIEIAS